MAMAVPERARSKSGRSRRNLASHGGANTCRHSGRYAALDDEHLPQAADRDARHRPRSKMGRHPPRQPIILFDTPRCADLLTRSAALQLGLRPRRASAHSRITASRITVPSPSTPSADARLSVSRCTSPGAPCLEGRAPNRAERAAQQIVEAAQAVRRVLSPVECGECTRTRTICEAWSCKNNVCACALSAAAVCSRSAPGASTHGAGPTGMIGGDCACAVRISVSVISATNLYISSIFIL